MEKGWQRIYSSDKPHLIEIAKTVLKENNIESYVVDKRDSTYITLGEMELYVKDDDVTLAEFLLKENQL